MVSNMKQIIEQEQKAKQTSKDKGKISVCPQVREWAWLEALSSLEGHVGIWASLWGDWEAVFFTGVPNYEYL